VGAAGLPLEELAHDGFPLSLGKRPEAFGRREPVHGVVHGPPHRLLEHQGASRLLTSPAISPSLLSLNMLAKRRNTVAEPALRRSYCTESRERSA